MLHLETKVSLNQENFIFLHKLVTVNEWLQLKYYGFQIHSYSTNNHYIDTIEKEDKNTSHESNYEANYESLHKR